MEYLVLCRCGHPLTLHDYAGCAGDRLRSCSCLRDRHSALDAAVDGARSAPVYVAAYEVRGNGVA